MKFLLVLIFVFCNEASSAEKSPAYHKYHQAKAEFFKMLSEVEKAEERLKQARGIADRSQTRSREVYSRYFRRVVTSKLEMEKIDFSESEAERLLYHVETYQKSFITSEARWLKALDHWRQALQKLHTARIERDHALITYEKERIQKLATKNGTDTN